MMAGLRLLAITGTRADFGLWEPVLRAAAGRADLRMSLLVAAMHLDPRFGTTADVVRSAGWEIAAEVPCTPEGDGRAEMAAAIGTAVLGMAGPIERAAPDWLCLLGDRGEQLAAALVGIHLGLPIVHLHGGERTLGAVDDTVRDVISRISHLHLVANREAAERLRRLGEQAWRIEVTGGPGIDAILERDTSHDREVRERYGVASGPYAILLAHPETVGERSGEAMLAAALDALHRAGLAVLAIAPNADAGGRAMLSWLERHRDQLVGLWPSVPHQDYLALLAGSAALVGNSSSGLIEAPALRVSAVNIGDRQRGRARGDNVIDVPVDSDAILAALERATSDHFRQGLTGISPYGDGHAAERIVEAIARTPIDDRLLRKQSGL